MRNFSQQIFEERYGRQALADWHLQWHENVLKLATPDPKTGKSEYPDILEMQGEGKGLICCPEDQICMRTCHNDRPVCGKTIAKPSGLRGDNSGTNRPAGGQ